MKTSFLPIFCSILMSLFLFNANSQVINVPADYSSIQSALDNANEGDTVLVQPGTYYENIVWPLQQGVKLISAGDTTNTIINGNSLSSVISFNNSISYDINTMISGFKITNGENGVFLKNSNILIDNLLITNNKGSNYGVGIHCIYSNPKIINSQISYNELTTLDEAFGGGMYLNYSNPTITNTDIIHNNLKTGANKYAGAGIYCYSDCAPQLTNVKINNNTSGDYGVENNGTGMYCYMVSNPKLNMVEISNNSSGNFSNEYYGIGFYCFLDCLPELNNVTIKNNIAGNNGLSYEGGGIYTGCGSSPIINNTKILDNRLGNNSNSSRGGGVCISQSYFCRFVNSVIKNNSLGENSLSNEGAGLYIGQSVDVKLENVIITENFFSDINNECFGGGIYSISPQLEIYNSTIAHNYRNLNSPTDGSGIYSSNLKMTNSICINENSGNELFSENPNIKYSNIRGGYQGEGNIDADPLFISSTDYHLQEESPCIASGTIVDFLPYDIEGNPRPLPVGSNPDMGAYEMDYSSPSPAEIPISNRGIIIGFVLIGAAFFRKSIV